MSAVEILHLSLSGAGVAIGASVWFRLGVLTQGHKDHARRIENLEKRLITGGYIPQ